MRSVGFVAVRKVQQHSAAQIVMLPEIGEMVWSLNVQVQGSCRGELTDSVAQSWASQQAYFSQTTMYPIAFK